MEDEPDGSVTPSGTSGIVVETLEAGTPVPGLALTPRPGVIADMPTARRYEAEGDIEAATEAYVAMAASQSPDRVEAGLAAARLLMVNDDYEDARTLLEPLVQSEAGSSAGLTATYLLGRAYAGLEMWPEALRQYDAYIGANGVAAPYAYLDRSEALVEMERGFEAADSAQAGLNLGVPVSLTRTFLLTMAQSYERAGAFVEAIAQYELFIALGYYDSDVAQGLQRIATLKELLGDPTYTVERDRLLREYPFSYQAFVTLQEAVAAGVAVPPNVHGLILYRQNEYTLAEPHFREQVEAFPGAPESALAHYYLGAIVESRGEFEEALENYALVDVLDPNSHLADDALWWRARILEHEDELAEAAALYARLVDEYPDSSFASDAAFRRGMIAYRGGSYLESAQIWQEDLDIVADAAARHRLELWRAKALMRAGETSNAVVGLDGLTAANQHEYFGIRARGLREGLHEHHPVAGDSGLDLSPDWDWAAAEQWLMLWTGQPVMSRAWEADPRWARAQELWRAGRSLFGDLEIYALIEAHADDELALYTLSRELLREGRISMSARVGHRLLIELGAQPSDGLPRAVMSLAYPAAFGPLVQRYAEAEGISPLLMLAFIRQESFFEPRAISPAGALGLTQLLPESAQMAAGSLGITAEVPRHQLLHADLNLRLGARFMAEQLERFDGNLFVALAAYNGGPTAAARWDAAAGNDADLFVETVEYDETRLYVEIVAENYAIYRFIYAGEPEPNLPR